MVKKLYSARGLFIIAGCFLLIGCELRVKKEANDGVQHGYSSGDSQWRNFFGDTFLALGGFIKNVPDSVETGLWQYTKLDTPLVLFGNFYNGLPFKEWRFVLPDGKQFASYWNTYENSIIPCRFSMPFNYEEKMVDSGCFNLTARNDSLGIISITINVGKAISEYKKLVQFASESEAGLVKQGFTFTKKRKEIKNNKASYFFTEFFMKSPRNKNVKFFHVYGNLPSKSHCVEFSFYHDGPKEELVTLIFDMIVNNLYIGNERFYNPYLR